MNSVSRLYEMVLPTPKWEKKDSISVGYVIANNATIAANIYERLTPKTNGPKPRALLKSRVQDASIQELAKAVNFCASIHAKGKA